MGVQKWVGGEGEEENKQRVEGTRMEIKIGVKRTRKEMRPWHCLISREKAYIISEKCVNMLRRKKQLID